MLGDLLGVGGADGDGRAGERGVSVGRGLPLGVPRVGVNPDLRRRDVRAGQDVGAAGVEWVYDNPRSVGPCVGGMDRRRRRYWRAGGGGAE